jgi:subtilisin family serine protease
MRHFSFFLLVVLSIQLRSQQNLNGALKSKIYNHELDNQFFDVLIEGDMNKLLSQEKALGITVKYHAGEIACVNLDVNAISTLINLKIAKYIEYIDPSKKTMNDTMVVRNRIKPVKQGLSPLPQAYDGTGIVVGIIDTGIDFSHPDFKDAMGNTRIDFIWDQTINTPTTSPMPFNYGQEWTAAQINASLCTHQDTINYGHGTHVSGITAGNGLANGRHEGCAPKSNLVVVALNFYKPGPTIADGVQYIINKATALGKPFVINASVGDYYGSHDGTDTEAKLIDAMIANIPGRVLIAAAGNAGSIKYHTGINVIPADTGFTWIKNNSSTLYYWHYADTANIKNVNYSIGVNRSGSFTDLGNIGFKPYNYGFSTKTDTLKFNSNRIGLIQSSASINASGIYELFVKITADTTGYFWRIESNGTGNFDAWNFDFVSSGLPSSSTYPKITKYVTPDTLKTIVSSFQCSDNIITVANYSNLKNFYDVTNALQTCPEAAGALISSSSVGPTRDNRMKPDVAASGNYIFSAILMVHKNAIIANNPIIVSQGGYHIIGGGTSAASPVVAGLAALYMQAHPNATNLQVKQAIINCTYSDGFTGTVPNIQWGYGKLDGLSTFTCAAVTGINSFYKEEEILSYPNPFSDGMQFKFKNTIAGELNVYNALGALVFKDFITSDEYFLSKKRLGDNGVYFVNIPSQNINYKIVAVE